MALDLVTVHAALLSDVVKIASEMLVAADDLEKRHGPAMAQDRRRTIGRLCVVLEDMRTFDQRLLAAEAARAVHH